MTTKMDSKWTKNEPKVIKSDIEQILDLKMTTKMYQNGHKMNPNSIFFEIIGIFYYFNFRRLLWCMSIFLAAEFARSNLTTSLCTFAQAFINAVLPISSLAFSSIMSEWSSSNLTTSLCPFSQAIINAVSPSGSVHTILVHPIWWFLSGAWRLGAR